jgi:hypothetical protein
VDDDICFNLAFTCILFKTAFNGISGDDIFTLQHRYSEESFRPMLFLDMTHPFHLNFFSVYCAQNCWFFQLVANVPSRHRFSICQLYISVCRKADRVLILAQSQVYVIHNICFLNQLNHVLLSSGVSWIKDSEDIALL